MENKLITISTIGAFAVAVILVFVKVVNPMEVTALDLGLVVSFSTGVVLMLVEQYRLRQDNRRLAVILHKVMIGKTLSLRGDVEEMRVRKNALREKYTEVLNRISGLEMN